MVGSGVVGVGFIVGAALGVAVGDTVDVGCKEVVLVVGVAVASVGEIVGEAVGDTVGETVEEVVMTGADVSACNGVDGMEVGDPRMLDELFDTSEKSNPSVLLPLPLALLLLWEDFLNEFPINTATAATTPAMTTMPPIPAARAIRCRLDAIIFVTWLSSVSAEFVSKLSKVGFSSILIV